MTPVIQLYSGEYFDYTRPDDGPYHITDIARSLSNLCRYTGHVSHFYSVAQHCVLASQMAPPFLQMAALLHDAAEAYLGDVNSPLKTMLPDYARLEEQVERALFERFHVPWEQMAQIKSIDWKMLATERFALMPLDDTNYWPDHHPYLINIRPWDPLEAEQQYLNRFMEIYRR